MAPVRVEDVAWRDWRFAALAKRFGYPRAWAIGTMAAVWSHCTEQSSAIVRREALAVLGDIEGFAEAVVACDLGEDLGDGTIRVRGTVGRIEWLAKHRAGAAAGGKSRAAGAARGPNGHFGPAPHQHPTSTPPAPSSPPSLSLSLSPKDTESVGLAPDALTLAPATRKPMNRAKLEATAFVEWFNRIFARSFQVRDSVVAAVKVLLAKGYTQGGMRLVAQHLRTKWESDERMAQHLVPSVIFRLARFGERLDEARAQHPAWAAEADEIDRELAMGGGGQ